MKGICLQCGAEFKNRRALDFRKKNPQQVFCSKVCAGAYKHEHNPICPECGRRHNGDADGPCCCCKKKMEHESSLHKRCEICGAEFVGVAARCSDECNKEQARRMSKVIDSERFYREIKARVCKWCGKEFTPDYGSKKRTYCSDECLNGAMRDIKKAVKRARKRKTTKVSDKGWHYNPINLRRLWLRDGGVCKICGKKVDWKLKRSGDGGPDTMCATRDHIIPIACGGEHTWGNVRLAHFKCNYERGTGGVAQLLLFG